MAYKVKVYEGTALCVCGRVAKYTTLDGRYVCGTNPSQCPVVKAKRKAAMKVVAIETSECCLYCGNKAYFQIGKVFCCKNAISSCPKNKSKNTRKVEKITTEDLCSYGCGQQAKWLYANNLCCSYHPTNCPSVMDRREASCLERFGFKYAMQNLEVAELQFQSSVQAKTYSLADGRVIKLRGYEKLALDYLRDSVDISTLVFKPSEMPNILYDDGGALRRYIPDFYSFETKTVYEVKSFFTLTFKNVERKFNAATKNGFNLVLLLFSEKELEFKKYWSSGEFVDLSEILESFNLKEAEGFNLNFCYDQVVKLLKQRLESHELCDYGCGKLAKYITNVKARKICCSKISNDCIAVRASRWKNRPRVTETREQVEQRFKSGGICDYGCGQRAKYLLELKTKSSLCCSRSSGCCPAIIERRWKNRLLSKLGENQ
jgi:hypothetical protein